MDKLKKIIDHCKCGVFITIDDHKNSYADIIMSVDMLDGVPDEIKNKMIEMDTIVEVQCYPDTPIGFFHAYHYDLDAALSEVLIALKVEA